MNVGSCWFDDARGELQNRTTGDVWHLPRAELQVLRLLTQSPGKVVAKAQLRGGDEEHGPLTDSSVARAVFMLRSFIGPGSELVIETVKGQGYLLRAEEQANLTQSPQIAFRPGQLPLWLFAPCLLLAVVVWLYHSWQGVEYLSESTAPYRVEHLTQADGQSVRLALYAHSRSNNALLVEKAAMIGRVLAECRDSRWRDVFVSLSHDSRVLNLTLRGEYMGQAEVRNLKLSDGREPREFISAEQLRKVDLCD